MSQIQDIRIQQKVDTKAMWETNNPQLLDKEIGYEKETGRYKIGELNEEKEQKHWNELPYAQNFQKGSGENSILQAKINDTWSKSQTLYLTKISTLV